MPGLRTSLREHSGWSSGASRSWSSHQNILWMYRHKYFLPLQQFTTVSLKGIPLRSLVYYPHLMMALSWRSWSVCDRVSMAGRERQPMPDVIRLQRVCGMIFRECFKSVICSHIALSPNNITLCFHCFTVQNTNTKKISIHGNHKVAASSLLILGSSSMTGNSFTTYFMSTNCFLTHNLWSNGCWIDM